MEKLTEYQKQVLQKFIPDGWFLSTSLSHAIHGRDGVCRKLVKKGALEEKSACPKGVDHLTWIQCTNSDELNLYRKVDGLHL